MTQHETQIIDKLFLELSQISSARAAREMRLLALLRDLHRFTGQQVPGYENTYLWSQVVALLKDSP